MTWFKVDDAFYRSGKVRRLGSDRVAAVGLWTLCGNWSGDNLTDGFVPWEVIEDWDPERVIAKKLIDVKLWTPVSVDDEEGVQYHDWADWQPTREDVMNRRKADAERRARWREARKATQESRSASRRDTPRDETRDTWRDASELNPKEPAQGEESRCDPTVSSRGVSRVGSALPDPTRPDPTRSSLREESVASNARPQRPTAEQLAKTATDPTTYSLIAAWRATHQPPYRADVYTAISKHVATLIATNGDHDAIKAALAEWDRRADAKPGLFPHLYDDALHQRRPGAASKPVVVNGTPTVPVEQIPDDAINPDEILGRDYWTPPTPPRDIDEGPEEELDAWVKARVAEHRADRVAEARRALIRRQNRSTA